MERLEISIPGGLKRALRARARADVCPLAEVTRAALEAYFARDYRALVRNLMLAETRNYRRAAEDSKDGSFDFPDAFARQVFKIFESVMEVRGLDAAADLCRELGLSPDDGQEVEECKP